MPLPPRSPAATRGRPAGTSSHTTRTEQHGGSRKQRAARRRTPLGGVDAPHLPRGPVHLLDSSPNANRTAAVAGVGDLLAPAPEAIPRPLERHQQDRRVGTVTPQ